MKSFLGIVLKPLKDDQNLHEWKSDGRKYSMIGIKGSRIFNISFNVSEEYYEAMIQLAKKKYSQL